MRCALRTSTLRSGIIINLDTDVPVEASVAPKRKRKRPNPRKWTEADLRRVVRQELLNHADEFAPHVLRALLEGERKRPGKLRAM